MFITADKKCKAYFCSFQTLHLQFAPDQCWQAMWQIVYAYTRHGWLFSQQLNYRTCWINIDADNLTIQSIGYMHQIVTCQALSATPSSPQLTLVSFVKLTRIWFQGMHPILMSLTQCIGKLAELKSNCMKYSCVCDSGTSNLIVVCIVIFTGCRRICRSACERTFWILWFASLTQQTPEQV